MDRVRQANEAGTRELSVGEVGREAAESIRTLNHLTQPAKRALSGPAETAELAAALACLTGRLPQLLGQLGQWLRGEQRAGRLRVDALSPSPDVAATTDAAVGLLGLAAEYADAAARALDAAHQQLAHLACTASVEHAETS
jgi:hypothetical protein